jgi:uncharacterized membrane protein YeaQ/YmgE (transglycosylase-associated protein family)
MSYLWVGLIGALVGWLTGQFVTGSRQGIAVDLIAGAIGAWLAVVLSRAIVPDTASGFLMSAIVAVVGAIIMLVAMNRFIRAPLIASSRMRRRL